jgi:5'-nucleotidase
VNILITNDDGVLAPSIHALAAEMSALGRVVIVAPESERSGFSSAITLDRPLKPSLIREDVWAVNGTPADCVFLALNGFLDITFDLVISGINNGANLGDHIIYSGTVAGAFEGRNLQLPALAVSLVGPKVRGYTAQKDFEDAAVWVRQFIQQGLPKLPPRHIFNINIPDVKDIKGVRVTYQGNRRLKQPVVAQKDLRGRDVYWINFADYQNQQMQNTANYCSDFEALAAECVSVTPLNIDATNYSLLDDLQASLSIKQD